MNEQSTLISAFEQLRGEGKPAALATVVAVSGSAYRRPGARMLVAEDGRTWGGVSGGCLERDVIRRSRGVLSTGRPVTCRYETTDDEDLTTGVATGCRGTVDLFIEPLSSDEPGPIPWLTLATRERRCVTLATILRTSGGSGSGYPGARISLDTAGATSGGFIDPALVAFCLDVLSRAGPGKLAMLAQFRVQDATIDATTDVFIERLPPPQELIIFGGGPDAVPVVAAARLLGWRVSVIGVRPTTGLAQRFAEADAVRVTSPEEPMAGVEITGDTAVVLMTHNYPRDLRILAALPVAPRYLGILGPRSRTEQLLAELGDDNPLYQNVHAPIGLDLGAETPEEIALSIVAEIQAVLRSRPSGFLRDRNGPIHPLCDDDQAPAGRRELKRIWREAACPI